MSPDWRSSAAIEALDRAGLTASDDLAERLVRMLQGEGHYRHGERLEAAVKELAADLPELFGGEPDDSDDPDRDDFHHLHPEGQDLRHAEAWRALNRAGFAGSRRAMRRMVALLAGEKVRGGQLLEAAATDLIDQAPELFFELDGDEGDGDEEPEDLDRQGLYESHLARMGPTYEGPLRTDATGEPLSEAVAGKSAGSARTTAALLAQAGVKPSRGRPERAEPRDASERTSARLLEQAGG